MRADSFAIKRFIKQWMNRMTTKMTMLMSKSVMLVFRVYVTDVGAKGVCIAYQFLRKNISIAVCLES